MAAFGVSGV
ncbi:hypothetical protein MIMGU_mgv1a0217392mg, partial [Erythranthe guttata]